MGRSVSLTVVGVPSFGRDSLPLGGLVGMNGLTQSSFSTVFGLRLPLSILPSIQHLVVALLNLLRPNVFNLLRDDKLVPVHIPQLE